MPFDFKKYDAKCAAMDAEALQREWDHYTRLISGAASSTAVSGMAVPFTLGVSAVGIGFSGPAIHNARKKREIVERHLQRVGANHQTRKRDVLAAASISGTVGLVTLGVGTMGAEAITSNAAEHGFQSIAENELAVKTVTHIGLDAAAVAGEEAHMQSKKEQQALKAYAEISNARESQMIAAQSGQLSGVAKPSFVGGDMVPHFPPPPNLTQSTTMTRSSISTETPLYFPPPPGQLDGRTRSSSLNSSFPAPHNQHEQRFDKAPLYVQQQSSTIFGSNIPMSGGANSTAQLETTSQSLSLPPPPPPPPQVPLPSAAFQAQPTTINANSDQSHNAQTKFYELPATASSDANAGSQQPLTRRISSSAASYTTTTTDHISNGLIPVAEDRKDANLRRASDTEPLPVYNPAMYQSPLPPPTPLQQAHRGSITYGSSDQLQGAMTKLAISSPPPPPPPPPPSSLGVTFQPSSLDNKVPNLQVPYFDPPPTYVR